MRTSFSLVAVSALTLAFAACTPAATVPSGGSSSSAPQSGTTVGWKVVGNPGGKYEVQVPAAWVGEIQSDGQYALNYSGTNGTMQAYVAYAQGAMNISSYLQKLDAARATGYEGQPSHEVKDTGHVTIDGTPGAQRREYALAAGFEMEVTYVLKNDKVYTLSTWHEGNEMLTADDIAFHAQMAKTMKIGE